MSATGVVVSYIYTCQIDMKICLDTMLSHWVSGYGILRLCIWVLGTALILILGKITDSLPCMYWPD